MSAWHSRFDKCCCQKICGDANYTGRVVATNAYQPEWNLTPYKNTGSKKENATWAIRTFFDYNSVSIVYSGSVVKGELLDLPSRFTEPQQKYSELIVSCGCVESQIDAPEPHFIPMSFEEDEHVFISAPDKISKQRNILPLL
jgi:hypothetical protein